MEFTYKAYENLIEKLYDGGYSISDYHGYAQEKKCAILRHDVDYDLKRAVPFATLEADSGAKSTYFVLLSSDFYNLFSKESLNILHKIQSLGHEIGLHFDEVRYMDASGQWDEKITVDNILREARILSDILGTPIKAVSMHRPSKNTLESNLEIPGLINSYSSEFFKNFKYVSDSRMRWREDVDRIVNDREYDRLHILTHPFWYGKEEQSMKDVIVDFIDNAKAERFEILKENITDLEAIVKKREI